MRFGVARRNGLLHVGLPWRMWACALLSFSPGFETGEWFDGEEVYRLPLRPGMWPNAPSTPGFSPDADLSIR